MATVRDRARELYATMAARARSMRPLATMQRHIRSWPARSPAGSPSTGVEHDEREVKLAAPPDFALPDLDGVDGMTVLSDESVDLDAVYYDTDDLRLTRAGVSVRFRSDERAWTVKMPMGGRGNGSALERVEHRIEGRPGKPPPPVEDFVRAWSRAAALRPVATLHTHRRRVALGGEDDGPLVEVDDDDVRGWTPETGETRFHEIEVEIVGDGPSTAQARVVSKLTEAGARTGTPLPKVARTLGPRALAPPDLVVPDAPTKRSRVRAVAEYSLVRSVDRLLRHDPAVRLGSDAEAVHQARVATRRLRSDLRTLRPVLHREVTDPLRDELRWLATKLGAVRDADVLGELFRDTLRTLAVRDESASTVFAALEDEHARHRAALLEAMQSDRYTTLIDQLVAIARRPPLIGKQAGKRAAKVMPHLVRKPWKQVRTAAAQVESPPTDLELHMLRKRAKQARYASEAAAPVIGKPARRFAKAMRRIQDELGAHQDAVVARRWLRDHFGAGQDTGVCFVAGELAGLCAAERRARRDRWSIEWRRARRKRLRRWL